jgi:hypothetical protein
MEGVRDSRLMNMETVVRGTSVFLKILVGVYPSQWRVYSLDLLTGVSSLRTNFDTTAMILSLKGFY